MPTRESAAARGARRSRLLRLRTGDELASARRTPGLSLREVGRRVGVSPQRVARAERGEPDALSIDLAARLAVIYGLQLAVSLHPDGDRIRDRAHVALLERFSSRLTPTVNWRTEVPIPITGDQRSGDGMVAAVFGTILVEAETHLGDFQALERRIAAKARDLGADRVVLLLADTRHNRALLDEVPAIRDRFPIDTRTWFRAIHGGADPGGDAVVIL